MVMTVGYYSLSCATELVHGCKLCDPVLCSWDVPKMRQHLLDSSEKGHLNRLPCTGPRCVRFGRRITKSVYCSCRMPNDRAMAMIYCDHCVGIYHDVLIQTRDIKM